MTTTTMPPTTPTTTHAGWALPTTPCVSPELTAVLNEFAEVEWQLRHTLAARLMGVDGAVRFWDGVADGRWSVLKVVLWISCLVVWVGLTIALLCEATVPLPVYIASSVVMAFILVITGAFFFDMRIARMVVPTAGFVSNLLISIIAAVGVGVVWNGDERCLIGVAIVLIVAYVSAIDAFPPDIRRVVGIPLLVLINVALFGAVAALSLWRFPGQVPHLYVFGNLDGLAARNVTIDVTQLAIDSSLGISVLMARTLIVTVWYRNTSFLAKVTAPILCRDPEGFVPLAFMMPAARHIWSRGLLRAPPKELLARATRRIPVYDPRIAKLVDLNTCTFEWSLAHTPAARLFGAPFADKLLHAAFGHKLGAFGILLVVLTYAATSIFAMYATGPESTPIPAIAATAVVFLAFALILLVLCDLRMLRLVAFRATSIALVFFGVLGAVVITIVWNARALSVIAIPVVLLAMLVAWIDTLPPRIRQALGVPAFILLLLVYFFVVGAINLGRFPGFDEDHVVTLGYFGGLAARPVQMNLIQILNDALVAHILLMFRAFWRAAWLPYALTTLDLNVVSVADRSFMHFRQLAHVRLLGVSMQDFRRRQTENAARRSVVSLPDGVGEMETTLQVWSSSRGGFVPPAVLESGDDAAESATATSASAQGGKVAPAVSSSDRDDSRDVDSARSTVPSPSRVAPPHIDI